MVPKYHTKQLQNRCTAVPVFKPATHSVCCSNPAGSRRGALGLVWQRRGRRGRGEVGGRRWEPGLLRRKRRCCSRAGEIPPARADGREVSHLAEKDSKTGTEREISASLCLLFCKRSTSCFPPNSSSITFKEDHTLQTFFYYMCVCIYTLLLLLPTDYL